MKSAKVNIPLPYKGIDTSSNLENLPPGTCPFMRNVIPTNTRGGSGRTSLAQRDGTTLASASVYGGGNPIQRMHTAVKAATSVVAREDKLLVVANGGLYVATDPSAGAALVTAGLLSTTREIGSADMDQIVYFVDGLVQPKKYSLATGATSTLAATAGVLPNPCKLVATWRGRLVLANDDTNPQNVYMSRAGTPTDFDYSQDDVQAAVALNASSTVGRIGEAVTALIPFRDDSLILGLVNGVFIVKGDPAEGGSVLAISESVGISGMNAWTIDPKGRLYFLSATGLHRFSPEPGAVIENLSHGRCDQKFTANFGTYQTLVYDDDRRGVYIFFGPDGGSGGDNAMWYDEQLDGFFPLDFWPGQVGRHAFNYRNSTVFVGGTDGKIREVAAQQIFDDGELIDSQMWVGPIFPGGINSDAVLTGMEFVLDDDYSTSGGLFNLKWTIQKGSSGLNAAFYGGTQATGNATLASNNFERTKHFVRRVRGPVFVIRMENFSDGVQGYHWSIAQLNLTFAEGGKKR